MGGDQVFTDRGRPLYGITPPGGATPCARVTPLTTAEVGEVAAIIAAGRLERRAAQLPERLRTRHWPSVLHVMLALDQRRGRAGAGWKIGAASEDVRRAEGVPGPSPGISYRDTTVLGAGTVLDRRACGQAIAAGARFVVSPVTDPPVLEQAHRDGVPYVGGALTPTEVLASMRAGADAVKLFPVGSVGGAAYLRALREPLPALRAVVSGGIGAADAQGYLAAGAHAVCLGGALIDRAAAGRGDVEAVAARARQGLAQVREVPEPC